MWQPRASRRRGECVRNFMRLLFITLIVYSVCATLLFMDIEENEQDVKVEFSPRRISPHNNYRVYTRTSFHDGGPYNKVKANGEDTPTRQQGVHTVPPKMEQAETELLSPLKMDIAQNEEGAKIEFSRRRSRVKPPTNHRAYRQALFHDVGLHNLVRTSKEDAPTRQGNIQMLPLQLQNNESEGFSHLEVSYQRSSSSFFMTARDGDWQTVSNTRKKFYVYSAFYDSRNAHIVRVIGTTSTRFPEKVWCILRYNQSRSEIPSESPYFETVPATVNLINEHWYNTFSACFVLCPVQYNLSPPNSVSIVGDLSKQPTNNILVHRTYKDPHGRRKYSNRIAGIAMCVKPLHNYYNKALSMLEFLELNSILGVTHFFMYNHTVGPEVNCILEDYVSRGILTLLPWNLELVTLKEIRNEGKLAAMNDCMYRSMFRYSYTVITDLDEYIIPKGKHTLQGLINWLRENMKTANQDCYSFTKAYFYLHWPDDPTVTNIDRVEKGLVTLHKTRHGGIMSPQVYRSKYMCRPETVVQAGNYFVWEFIPGRYMIHVPVDVAIVHQYGTCEFGGDRCTNLTTVVDRTLLRYREILTERVTTGWSELEFQCRLP